MPSEETSHAACRMATFTASMPSTTPNENAWEADGRPFVDENPVRDKGVALRVTGR